MRKNAGQLGNSIATGITKYISGGKQLDITGNGPLYCIWEPPRNKFSFWKWQRIIFFNKHELHKSSSMTALSPSQLTLIEEYLLSREGENKWWANVVFLNVHEMPEEEMWLFSKHNNRIYETSVAELHFQDCQPEWINRA